MTNLKLPLFTLNRTLKSPLKNIYRWLTRTRRRKILSGTLAVLILLTSIRFAFFGKEALAGWSTAHAAWAKRKQLKITNNSGDSLAANTTIAVTVNTKDLVTLGKIQSDCDDLRVVYQPDSSTNTELDRFLSYAGGLTCSTSEATKVYFKIQATLANAATSSLYYMYYANGSASSPSSTDNAFDIGSANAMLVCPFDGTTTCAAAEVPSTGSGAIRYSGTKSALSFAGWIEFPDSHGNVAYTGSGLDNLPNNDMTVEFWMNEPDGSGTSTPVGKRDGGSAQGWWIHTGDSGNLSVSFFIDCNSSGNAEWKTPNSVYSLNQWTQVAITWNGTTKLPKIFINGIDQSLTTVTSCDTSYGGDAGNDLLVGRDNNEGQHFLGSLDEVRISTGQRYTSNFTPSTAPFIRDSNTKLLYHFDENGNDPRKTGLAVDDSGNGYDGTITNAFYVAGLVGADNGTSDTGKAAGGNSYAGHEGIFVEEGTTNKITNPSFEHATYNTNWTASGGTPTENTTAPYYKFGSKSYKLVLANSTDQTVLTSINAGNTNTHTLSGYIFYQGTVDATVAKLVFNGSAQTTTYTETGGGWWKMTYSAAAGSGAQNYGVQLLADSATAYFDGFQLEEKAYATTYADGSLDDPATNYSWSGTINNSTSNRTVTNTQYATSNNINANPGSISFWAKPQAGITAISANQYLLDIQSDASNRIAVYMNATDDDMAIYTNGTTTSSTGITMAAGTWQHFILSYDFTADQYKLYQNGNTTPIISTTTALTAPTLPTNFVLGGDSTNANKFNGSISDFRSFNTVLTSAEVADIYYAGLVSRTNEPEIDRFGKSDDEPVAVWHFDEGYGTTAYDSTTIANDLTISGATWDVTSGNSRSQQSRNLKFDGTNDYVYGGNLQGFNFGSGSFTLAGWFRHSSTISGTDTLISQYITSGYKLYMNSSGYICAALDDDSTWSPDDEACTTSAQGSYADSRWHHFEVVKTDSTSLVVYIDGNEVARKNTLTATGSLTTGSIFKLGVDGTSNYWDGNMDEIFVYGYARSITQVKQDYLGAQTSSSYGQFASDPLSDGLAGYWNLDGSTATTTTLGETSVLTAEDSGNGNLILATKYTLSQTATIQSLSFYVRVTGGQLRLGIYDDAGGYPGTLQAETAAFTPGATGWATQNVVTPVELSPGDYWIAYHPESSTLGFWLESTGTSRWYDRGSFSALPGTFAGGATSGSFHWSFYATLNITPEVYRDSSGNGYTLINNGTTTFVGARFGNGSEHIPASSQYLSNASTISGVKTVSFWVNPDSTTNYYLSLTSGAYITSTGTISVTGFSNPKIYVNGVAGTTVTQDVWQLVTVTDDTAINANQFYVGRQGSNYFDGTMDEVRLYNRTFSPNEIRQLADWAPGPVGYWKLDEGSWTNDCLTDTVFDSSGNGLNGNACPSSTGPAGGAVGKFGKAGSFDGNDDYIDVPDPGTDSILDFGINDEITIAAWVKPESFTDYQGIVTKSDSDYNYVFQMGDGANTQKLRFVFLSNNFEIRFESTSDVFTLNSWTHVAVTYTYGNASSAKLYANGVNIPGSWTIGNGNETPDQGNSPLVIAQAGPINEEFDGIIDDVKVYNYARTPAQIIEDMNAGHPAPGSPVGSSVLWWKFDEGADNTCADGADDSCNSGSGGTTLDGTNTGIEWTNDGKFGKAIAMYQDNDTISAGDVSFLDGISQMTISMWLNPYNLTTSHDLIGKTNHSSQNSFLIRNDASNADELRIYIANAITDEANLITTTNLDLSTSAWQDLVFVYDGSQAASDRVKVYKNAIKINNTITGTIPTSLTSGSTSNLKLGETDATDTPQPQFGLYDEVKIYTSALTADQIKMEFNQGKAAVWGAKSTDTSGVGSWSARDEYCPPGNTEGNCAAGQNPSPVAEWKLDENTGTNARDTSGNGYNGTLTGSPLWANAKYGTGLSTSPNGTLQYVTVTDTGDLDFSDANDYTLESWIKFTAIEGGGGGTVYFIRKNYDGSITNPGYAMDVSDGAGAYPLVCAYTDGGGTEDSNSGLYSTNLNDGNWHHIACVMDRNGSEVGQSGLHAFVDGELMASDISLGETSAVNASAFDFGENSTGSEMTNGGFDYARVYRYARSQSQIAWDMNQGSPVAWWRMDENTGSAANDASGNGFSGTISGATFVTGKRNYALNFDGSNDYVNIGDVSIINFADYQDLSITGWFNRDTFDSDDTIVAKRNGLTADTDDGFVVYIDDSTDKLTFEVSESGGTAEYQIESASTFTASGWNHFAVVWDDSSVSGTKMYINGVEVNVTRTGTLANVNDFDNTVDLRIGGESDTDTDSPFDGKLDDIRVYSYALNQQQINGILSEGAMRFGPNEGSP